MRTYKDKTIKVVDTIMCDACGKNCTDDYGNHENATLEAVWGYWSTRDGQKFEVHLCSSCFDETLEFLKQKRKTILGPFKYPYDYDPLHEYTDIE
jgi:hypothetical protein